MRDDLVPEEKLLRLIRKKKVKTDAPAGASAGSGKAESAVRSNEQEQPRWKWKIPAYKISLAFVTTRRVIYAILALSLVYASLAFAYPLYRARKIILPTASAKTQGPVAKIEQQIKPFEYYQKEFQGKQLFGSVVVKEAPAAAAAIDPNLIKDLSLVGILAGDNPQAVIEDKKAQKTYYLNKGQLINDFTVEDILEGKVILNYQGQKFELYM